jgi:hypothetical protein
MSVFKIILNLMVQKAPLNQYYLNIGAHFLKKGAGFQIGQIVKEKHLYEGVYRVSVITGLFYNFQQNKVTHTAEKRIVSVKQEKDLKTMRISDEKKR